MVTLQVTKHFHDEAAARKFLENIRWPKVPICPHCGHDKSYRFQVAGKQDRARDVIKCAKCRKQYNIRTGTVFQNSHIPLCKWLSTIQFICSSKKGIRAHHLHRSLDITYKSAWFMTHLIRYAMTQTPLVEKLHYIVQADQTDINSKLPGRQWQEVAKKVPESALAECSGDIRQFHGEKETTRNSPSIINRNIASPSEIVTNHFRVYREIAKQFPKYHLVNRDISLDPLSFEEALTYLIQVKPPSSEWRHEMKKKQEIWQEIRKRKIDIF